jgi:hypothetical protein
LFVLVVSLLACGDENDFNPLPDAPVFEDAPADRDALVSDADGMMPDALTSDGTVADSVVTPDSTTDATPDATIDATPDSSIDATPDSPTPDSSTPDSSTPDSPRVDAGTDTFVQPDAPRFDAGTPDTFTFDAPRVDAGTPDTFTFDAPRVDAGTPDTFTFDSPRVDAGTPDTFTFDAPRTPDTFPPDPDGASGLIPACPVNTWCAEPSPVAGKLLTGVFAVSANEVFAVGASGTILRRTDSRWTQMASNTTNDLAAVWAASATDVWAVGLDGTIRRYDGSTWRVQASGTTVDLNAIWGSSANDVWIAGVGRVLHWDGTQFTTKLLSGTLLAIHGSGPNDVWVTGENALVDHFSNGTWTTGINPGTGTTYFSVHALAANNVFVGGLLPTKETLQFTGASWLTRAATGCIFQGLFSTSATNLWGVGGTRIGRWNGTTWTVEAPAGAAAQLWDVTGTGNHVWVVGSDSLILHRN